MNLSIIYARLIGIMCLIVPIGLMINANQLQTLILEIPKHPQILMALGFFNMIFGLIIVITHSIWEGWPMLITFIGYFLIARGFIFFYFSAWLAQILPMTIQSHAFYGAGIVAFGLGVILLYLGFKPQIPDA